MEDTSLETKCTESLKLVRQTCVLSLEAIEHIIKISVLHEIAHQDGTSFQFVACYG
uniref:Uncharacterized protein n=1 Tax=Arion vulgaris TaxID=1028688 RepID=A0A0B7BFH6_9EUPU